MNRNCTRSRAAAIVIVFAAIACRSYAADPYTTNPSPNPPPTFTVQDLGQMPPIADDMSVAVNASGIVALWQRSPTKTVEAAVWSNGATKPIRLPNGDANSVPHGINGNGDIVGWGNTSQNLIDSLSVTRGFVWRQGQMCGIGTLGGRNSQAFAINDHGQIVGVASRTDGKRHAFLLANSHMSDLGTLPGGDFSEAWAINSAGDIVGASNVAGSVRHAVLWHGGRIIDIGVLPGGTISSARAINAAGDIAGYADSSGGYHAFLYSKGEMHDLGTLGADPSEASGINDLGEVVGTSDFLAERAHAFLWQDGRMFDLNSLIPLSPAWTITKAYAINNTGSIACSGNRPGTGDHFLLLTPTPAATKP